MDFEDEATDLDEGSTGNESPPRASLHLELRVPDRHMLAAFRDAFLRWLTERSGLLGRAIGASDRLSLDEVPPDSDPQGMSTLRLTLSWPVGAKSAAAIVTDALPRAGDPLPGSASLTPVDQFVFFPDPPDAAAPLYRQLPDFLHAEALRTPPRFSRLRLWPAVHWQGPRDLAATVKAARASMQKRASALGMPGLTLRSPVLARHPRAWGFGLLATAAVAAGFVAGSIYLSVEPQPVSTAAAAERPASEPAGPSTPSPIVASTTPAAAPASLARVEPPADAAAPLAANSAPARTSASRSTEIPDTEVTRSRVRQNAVARPALPGRPSVVAVRAVDGKGSSSVTAPQQVRGALLVRSEPQGAEVSVNGVVHGRTPLVIRDLGAGSRVVRLDLPGYERWSWAVAIVANRRTPVMAKLQPEPRPSSQQD